MEETRSEERWRDKMDGGCEADVVCVRGGSLKGRRDWRAGLASGSRRQLPRVGGMDNQAVMRREK
jgi:hypothetical protein